VAEFVVATFKLGIWGDARTQLTYSHIDAVAQIRAEPIRAVPKGADPEFLSETVLDAVDGVLEATVAMRVRRGVPRVVAVTGTTGGGARLFALKTGGVLHVGVCRLELAWPGRKREPGIEAGHGWMRVGACAI
jgi:hypothetical protein